jgi:hypothetical protein
MAQYHPLYLKCLTRAKKDMNMPDNRKELEQVTSKPGVDKSNWEWITVPSTDIFGAPFTGVSINFRKFTPEVDDDGNYTGREGRYFLEPELAGEVRRLLKLRDIADRRVLQPNQDKELFKILARGGKPIPNQVSDADYR